MTSEQYWEDRALRNFKAGEKTLLQMLRELQIVYKDAIRQMEKQVNAYYGRHAGRDPDLFSEIMNENLDLAELRDFRGDVASLLREARNAGLEERYLNRLEALMNRQKVSRLDELQVHLRHNVERTYAEQFSLMNESLLSIYDEAYYRATFDVQQYVGVSYNIASVNVAAVESAVRGRFMAEDFSDRIWNDKEKLIQTLNISIPRGMAIGQNPRIIGQEIAREMGVRLNAAVRLARTEFNNTANQATLMAYKKSGIIQEYKYIATLDDRTSHWCIARDGKIYKLADAERGVNYPPMHANCRSTTAAYFPPDEIDAMFEKARRIAKDEQGNYYYVPADVTYLQWKAGLIEQPDGSLRYQEFYDKPRG